MARQDEEIIQHNQGKPFSYLEPVQLCTPPPSPERTKRSDHASTIRRVRLGLRPTLTANNIFSTAPCESQKSLRGSQASRKRCKRPSLAHRLPTQESYRRAHSDQRILSLCTSISRDSISASISTARPSSKGSSFRRSSSKVATIQNLRESDQLCSSILNKSMRRRLAVAKELLETEQRYVDNLFVIQFSFIEPLVQSLKSQVPVLSAQKMSDIFSNFVDILHINSTLLAMLQERLDPNETGLDGSWDPHNDLVGDIFTSFGHYLKMYKTYCRNFTAASIALQAELRDNASFRAFVNTPDAKTALANLTLQGHLLMPVQRVPRYRMLLSEMLKHTTADHPDHAALITALVVIEDVATGINESIRRHESWQELRNIEAHIMNLDELLSTDPSRVLVKRGQVARICSRSHQICEFFLFTDCLIYATPVLAKGVLHRGSNNNYYNFRRRVPLTDLTFDPLDIDPAHAEKFPKFLWRVLSSNKSFIAYSATEHIRADWLRTLEDAKLEHMTSIASIKASETHTSTLLVNRGRPASRLPIPILSSLAATIFFQATEYPILRNLAAPIWVEDSTASACQLCKNNFSFFRGRHHCRICGNLICASCSGKRFMTSSTSAALRSCDRCYTDKFSEKPAQAMQNALPIAKLGASEQSTDVPPIHVGTMGKSMRRTQGRHKRVFPIIPDETWKTGTTQQSVPITGEQVVDSA